MTFGDSCVAPASRIVSVVGLALALAACSGTEAANTTLAVPSGAVVVRAQNLAFATATVAAPANEPFVLYFDNADGFSHDVVIVGPDGSRVFAGDVVSGPAQRVYQVPALSSGAYTLHCDVHPGMSATLTVS